jgi:hypothetical protein
MSDTDAVLFANEAFYRAFADRDEEAMEDLWSATAQVACLHPDGVRYSAATTSWKAGSRLSAIRFRRRHRGRFSRSP